MAADDAARAHALLGQVLQYSSPGGRRFSRQLITDRIGDGTRVISFQVVQEVLNVTVAKMREPLAESGY